MTIINIFITVLVVISCLATLIPFLQKDSWMVRIFDYPKLQVLALLILSVIFLLFVFQANIIWHYVLLLALLLIIAYHAYVMLPYTFFYEPQVLSYLGKVSGDNENVLSLLVFNVYVENESKQACLTQIQEVDADVVLLLEPNQAWQEALKPLESIYEHVVSYPLDNAYGLLFYSKLALAKEEIKFWVEEDIPSICTEIILRSGKRILFYGVHPRPPIPTESKQSTERDVELLLVGKQVRKTNLPVIVAGDLNDVAWSPTSKLFLRLSGLLDPRIGRGLYNTFHAHYPLLRCPLDHIFISNHFKVKDIRRLDNKGSDHFPVYIEIVHDPIARLEQSEQEMENGDEDQVNEKIADWKEEQENKSNE